MRMRKKTLLWAVLAAVLVFSMTALFIFRASDKGSQTTLKITSDKADLEIKNVIYREVGGKDLKWEIRAERARYLKKEKQAHFDKVEVKLILTGGKTYVMTGDKGQLNTETKDMEISGNVVIVSGGGEKFETDYLKYSYSDRMLYTDAKVVMKAPKMQISGVGMSVSLANKNITLLSKVHARIEKKAGRDRKR